MRYQILICGILLAALSAPTIMRPQTSCHGPESLESAVRDHPSSKVWAALAGWFGEQGRSSCASSALHSALRLEPDSAPLHYYMGLTLHSEHKAEESLKELRRSIELDPAELRPRLLEGVILNDLGKRAEAEETWENALAIDPDSVVALDWLAKARIADRQFQAAIDLLQSAPADVVLTLDTALAYSQDGQFEKAVAILTTAVSKSPGDIRLNEALATLYVQSHRYQAAVDVLGEALKLHPKHQELELRYLQVLVLTGDAARARPLAEQILVAHPHEFEGLYLSGILDVDAQKYDSAIARLRAAAEINPDHYDVQYQLGVALLRTHCITEARDHLERAVALNPDEAQAHFQLAQALRMLNQSADAEAQLKQYKERAAAETNRALAANKSNLAERALRSGDAKQAVELYREGVAARPDDAVLQYNLAVALAGTGDHDAERAALEQALQLRPGFAEAENRLGYLAASSGRLAAAEQHFRNALAAAPSYSEAANNLGTLLGQQGRDHEAEVYFQTAVKANPRYGDAWVNLAATLASESQFASAREAVEHALRVDAENAGALRLRQMLPTASQAKSPTSPEQEKNR